jgi:hypothetical protein
MILAAATATAPERPRPTEYDRFRNHMGAAFANLEEARQESTPGRYTVSEDVTDALRTARVAVYKIGKAIALGYQNSDDSGTYAYSASSLASRGIAALGPFAGVRFKASNAPAGLTDAMRAAHAAFTEARDAVLESLDNMHD